MGIRILSGYQFTEEYSDFKFYGDMKMNKIIDENEKELPLIGRESAELHVLFKDCSGQKYDDDLREDIIRYVLVGAEIQRDKDFETLLRRYKPDEFERLRKKYEW